MGSLQYTSSDGTIKQADFVAVQQPDTPFVEQSPISDYYEGLRNALGSISKNFATSAETFSGVWNSLSSLKERTVVDSSALQGQSANGNFIKFADGTLIQWGGQWGGESIGLDIPYIDNTYSAILIPLCEYKNKFFHVQVRQKFQNYFYIEWTSVPNVVWQPRTVIVPCSVACHDTKPNGSVEYYAANGQTSGTVDMPVPDYPVGVQYGCQWITIGRWK